jgi:hypothetical protein
VSRKKRKELQANTSPKLKLPEFNKNKNGNSLTYSKFDKNQNFSRVKSGNYIKYLRQFSRRMSNFNARKIYSNYVYFHPDKKNAQFLTRSRNSAG